MTDILFLDNKDSFSYNLVDLLRINHHNVVIYRNDTSLEIITKKLQEMINPILLLSPGPGRPNNSGCMPQLIKIAKGKIPLIGICLGHQAIVEAYGGEVRNSIDRAHGKVALIQHDNQAMFQDLKNPLPVGRYHSLVCTNIPNTLTINAQYKDMVMAIRNDEDKVCGVQFHPESILTPQGSLLLTQMIRWAVNQNHLLQPFK